jgi:adenylosuccinate synthase
VTSPSRSPTAELSSLDGLEVEYDHRPGWTEDLTGIRRYQDLPRAARDYVEWVERSVGTPIRMLSIGPRRDQVIDRGM